jgi:hypothetical protein
MRGCVGEGGVTLDTRGLDPLFADDTDPADSDSSPDTAAAVHSTCEQLASLAVDCTVCPGDPTGSEAFCATVRFHGGVLQPSSEALPDEPATCGVDVETGEYSCNMGNITCAGAMLPIFGMAGFLRRRQRRA